MPQVCRCWRGGGCDARSIRCPGRAHPRGSLLTPDLGCAEPRGGWRARVPVHRRGEASADPPWVPRREQRRRPGRRVVVADTECERRNPDRRCIGCRRGGCRCARPCRWSRCLASGLRGGAGGWGGSAGADPDRRRARLLPSHVGRRAAVVAGRAGRDRLPRRRRLHHRPALDLLHRGHHKRVPGRAGQHRPRPRPRRAAAAGLPRPPPHTEPSCVWRCGSGRRCGRVPVGGVGRRPW